MLLMDHSYIISSNTLFEVYSTPLIILSVLIAILSSFTAFGTSERQEHAITKKQDIAWNIFGSIAMGSGIWAMHFIGMLALSLSTPISYNIPITLISVVPAIFACSVVLRMMAHNKRELKHLIIGGILLGSGIGLMHYIGMAAMRMDAVMVHNMPLFYVSLLVAAVLATIALKVNQSVKTQADYQFIDKKQIVSSIVMGAATSSMHYIAMASVDFYPQVATYPLEGMTPDTLISIVSVVVTSVLLVAIAIPYIFRHKQVSYELNTSLKRLDFALDVANQNWFDLNVQTRQVVVSDNYLEGLGYAAERYCGTLDEWRENIHPEDIDLVKQTFAKSLETGKTVEYEFRRKTKNGGWIWFHAIAEVSESDNDGIPLRIIGIQTDISERKEQQNKLELMAHYDVLTNLPNRTLFADRFSQAIARSKRTHQLLAICFLDLDNFKPINDKFGHDIGDQLLIEVARRIKSVIRDGDTVSRQGGDEFALLLGDLESASQCELLFERLRNLLVEPYIINGLSHTISASIGVTIYPSDEGDIDTLLRHADQAMYQSKLEGKNRYSLFDPLDERDVLQKQKQLQEIENALLQGELQLYYQPKVKMNTGDVFGAEALVRWIHPKRGVIPPNEFLPLIDGSNLEILFGDWVIDEALKQLEQWLTEDIKLQISINITSLHMRSASFIAHFKSVLALYPKINCKYLQLEILESSALGDLTAISQIITTCKEELGVQVALDDFGTSYSSLSHLRSLPAEVIKIDQSFVRDMLDDPNDSAIIEGIIGLAESFDRKIIAEGVESEAQGLMLMLMGCHSAQGYHIARPMPAIELPIWLNNYQPEEKWLNLENTTSIRNKKLQLLILVTQEWFNKFESKLLGNLFEGDWTGENKEQCSCAQWLRREKRGQLFSEDWLGIVTRQHNHIHQTVVELKESCLGKNAGISESELSAFRHKFEQLQNDIYSAFE